MANKTRIEFEGFDEVVKRLKDLDGDIRGVTEKALKETHKVITSKAEQAIQPHRQSGQTERSLKRSSEVEWAGTLASIETGFDIAHGGLPSIFLMNGTKVNGTPRIKKDQKLYNAFFGAKTKKEIQALQQEMFYEEIRRLNG